MAKQSVAIVVAAGKGLRMGTEIPKQLLTYRGKTVLQCAVEPFLEHEDIAGAVIVIPRDGDYTEVFANMADSLAENYGKPVYTVPGGAERGDSVCEGLLLTGEKFGMEVNVLIHDGARPNVTREIINRNIEALKACNAVCTAVKSIDSLRIISDCGLNTIDDCNIMGSNVLERERVYNVQTPQSFDIRTIIEAYEYCRANSYRGTDDASVAEVAGSRIAIVEGDYSNIKVTTKGDIPMSIRMGNGFDVHRLVPDRDLILCGTPVPSELGLLGHSDADVAIHALMDAILGAAGMGDIGRHFPDTDEKYAGADSMKLLEEVLRIVGDVTVLNADITIIAQRPKLAPYIETMRNNTAAVLGVPCSRVNVKATTTEKLGFAGRGEGIAALATCTIEGRFE